MNGTQRTIVPSPPNKCWRIFLVLIPLLALHFLPGPPTAFALSIEDEKKLGQKVLANIRRHYEIVDDDFARDYINDLGSYLIESLETRHFPFHFYIIKDNSINAFAGPGGHIFFFTALIEVMEEVDELAAVMCHEIGHVSARHISQRIEYNKKIGIATMAGMLAGALVGGKMSGAIMTGSMAAGIQKQLNYSRNDERQADQLGVSYMDKAGFDPSRIIDALRRLGQGQWLASGNVPPYLLTHPAGPERMANIEAMLSDHASKPPKDEAVRFRADFPLFKTILRARYLEPHDAERLFKRKLEKEPDSALAHLGLGIVMKERSEYVKAIDHLKKALEGLPGSIVVLRQMGEVYRLEGQDREAIKILEQALAIDSQDRASLFLLALSFQNIEEYSKAVRIYNRLISMKPVKDEVFYNLGLSYGRQDKLPLAHYNFGIYFKRLKKPQKARFHFRKAEELSSNDPALKGRIRIKMKDLL